MTSPAYPRNRMLITLGLVWLCLIPPSFADGLRVIELDDGSQIAGEIVLFEHGVYTIESETLGRLHIPDADVRAIRAATQAARPGSGPAPAAPATPSGPGLTDIESQILGDPEILSLVMTLQQDPEVLAVLNDPAIMQAIAARDFDALQHNARLLRLEHNPTIRRILDLVVRQ